MIDKLGHKHLADLPPPSNPKLTPSEILESYRIDCYLANKEVGFNKIRLSSELKTAQTEALKQLEEYYGAEFYSRFEKELEGLPDPFGRTTDIGVAMVIKQYREAARKASGL